MSEITLLDCTLRDGGYINDWCFGKNVIKDICNKLSESKMDIIEIGFLTDLPHTEEQSLYSNCEEIDEKCCIRNSISMFAAMIAIGEKEMNPISLPMAKDCMLDIVRITFHRNIQEIEKAEKYAHILMDKGYKVCMQPVGTTSYSDKHLIELIERMNMLKPYAFYLVDTLGILCREELMRFVYLIDNNLDSDIKIGFHSHNNMQMSFSNAQYLIEHRSAREFIVDCSVYGMGRGAGNLCTELIAQYLNTNCSASYNMVSVLEVLDGSIYPIHLKSGWGYNAHYYIAATHKCHPNYASYLINKQSLTMNEVDYILKNIPKEQKDIFNKKLIKSLYYDHQNRDTDDTAALAYLKNNISNKEVLLIAPGKSVLKHKDKIVTLIEERHPIIITINTACDICKSDFIFISNLKRLYAMDQEKINAPLIITSNLPVIMKDCLCVNYSMLCEPSHDEPDNSGVMVIRLMKLVGANKIYLAGYDGFDEDINKNYYDPSLINSVDLEKLHTKNLAIRDQLTQLKEMMELVFITPSKYIETDGDES